jgi:hypothetical protein
MIGSCFAFQGRQREFAALSVQFELLFCTSVRRVCSKPSSILGRPSRVTSDRLDSLSLLHLAVCDNKATTLQQLLVDYFRPEDKKADGLLVSRLADVPTNLSILLKRVQMGNSRSAKRMAQVTLPSCLALDCFAKQDVAEGKVPASVEMLAVQADSRRVYDLVSVVLHSGTVAQGHYTCACLGPDSVWSVLQMCLVFVLEDCCCCPYGSCENHCCFSFECVAGACLTIPLCGLCRSNKCTHSAMASRPRTIAHV